jgi:enoyl-CoA hydratase/3-hydroxyacyl-CoA dehydrogenase
MATLKKIGVIGAGNMGSGIAQKIATEGYPVALVDVSDEAAAAGIARIRTLLEEGVTRKLFTSDQVVAILSRLSAGSDFGLLADCDLVIEAVFEDRKVKADVFKRAAEKVSPRTVLASNTSSFRVADLSVGVPHPERFIGLHYFYHPAKNRLV